MTPYRFFDLLSRWRFFHDNAGGVVGHFAEGALRLAKAEIEMRERGWRVEWVDDDDPDLGDHEYWCDLARSKARGSETRRRCQHEVLIAVLRDSSGAVLASLGSIIDPTVGYARVIGAELASEALANDRESSAIMAL